MSCNPRDAAIQGQEVALQIQYYDNCGRKVVADDIPFIQITDLDGNVVLESTDEDVENLGNGLYQYKYRVPTGRDAGEWSDEWTAIIDEAEFVTSFTFSVITADSGLSADTGLGKIELGDSIVSNFSDQEIYGINVMLAYLKTRLRSTGRKPLRDQFGAFVLDGYGEIITEDCDVFTDGVLISLLCQSLSEFNSTPFFTAYTFADQVIQTLFAQVIVEGAYVYALASQSIIEKGRDFTITDGGVSYVPPQLGDFLQTHYGTWLTSYRERVKFIKNSIRPGPRSFGTYSNMTSGAPAFTRLRHLRGRRII